MQRLNQKRIVLTGAGRGLGQQLAVRLAREGANVLVLGRRMSKLEQTIELAEQAGVGSRLLARCCDVGVADQVEAIFAEVKELWGGLDALINNAAIYDFFQVHEADYARIKASVDANLLGPLFCIRGATPLLIAAGGGEIINVSSESVRNPYAFLSVYAATKAGLENLSQGLKQELRPHGVRIGAIRLGTMADENREVLMDAEQMQRFMQANIGALQSAGGEMSYDTVVQVIVDMLCLPRDATLDLVELRAATPVT
jgi:NAD(P)-dependent dehydrogenase (short-subunit alcohol dehydrogenase family)